jgi:hypothetical protein
LRRRYLGLHHVKFHHVGSVNGAVHLGQSFILFGPNQNQNRLVAFDQCLSGAIIFPYWDWQRFRFDTGVTTRIHRHHLD